MSVFHKHEWREESRAYIPPQDHIQAESMSADLARQMLFGFTSIVLGCACGQKRETLALGKHEAKS